MTPRVTGTGTTLTLVPEVDDSVHLDLIATQRRHAMSLLVASRTVTLERAERAVLVSDLRALVTELGRDTPRSALVSVLMELVHETLGRCDDLPLSARNVLATWAGRPLVDDVSPTA